MAKVMIVGIDDPYGKTPLQPDIHNSSGQKLWLMSGLTKVRYVQSFDRRNLFEMTDPRDAVTARGKARRILAGIDTRYINTYIICLGREVANAFGLPSTARPLQFSKVQKNTRAAYMPHTSGLNRWYNKRENVAKAIEFMRQLAAVASGEIEDLPDNTTVISL
ncbi:MAG: hypothetical protein QNJ81_02095 [Acidimicrobiia bacterium]|nr:hypothetical protein [Acidimicrobiia bacterium]